MSGYRARRLPMMVTLLVATAAAVLTSGCTSAPASFYTLTTDGTLAGTGTGVCRQIAVGPVTVPEMIDRPQIVTRRSATEVTIDEYARWAEPVADGIARTLAGDVSRLLATAQVWLYPQTPLTPEACQVRVDILRFDAVPGEAAMIDALWNVRLPGRGSSVSGHSVVHEPVKAGDYVTLVTAESRALAMMSREIAAALSRPLP